MIMTRNDSSRSCYHKCLNHKCLALVNDTSSRSSSRSSTAIEGFIVGSDTFNWSTKQCALLIITASYRVSKENEVQLDGDESLAINPTKLKSFINLHHIVLQAIAKFQEDTSIPWYQFMAKANRDSGVQRKRGPARWRRVVCNQPHEAEKFH